MLQSGNIFAHIVAFIVLLNPFALCVYLYPVVQQLPTRDFCRVLFKASFISVVICFLFAFFGTPLFRYVFQIHFEAFRIFGGVVLFALALMFIVGGKESFISLKPDLDDVAAEIALPYMVGAGTISLSIVLGQSFSHALSAVGLVVAFAVNYGTVFTLLMIRNHLPTQNLRIAFDKIMGMTLRVNGFLSAPLALT